MSDGPPRTMTAIEIAGHGGPEMLRPCTRPVPEAGPDEVLIEVAVAGVNRPDCMQRAGRYAPPPGASDLPGLEVAGHVAGIGPAVEDWRVGDAVCALANGGGYAGYCAVPAGQCLPLPAGLDLEQAAALPENCFTVWTNLFDRGRLAAGETLLVHGGASGIGTTAIQLAVAFGARVIATAGTAEKVALCRRLGAALALDYHERDFVEAVGELTGGAGADVILDMVGGDYIARNLSVLAVEGRLVQIAFLRGSTLELDLLPVMARRQTITGSTLRPQSNAAKAAIAGSLRTHVWPLLEAGRMAPVIDRVLPLAAAAEAHAIMEANENLGKLLLRVRDAGGRCGAGDARRRDRAAGAAPMRIWVDADACPAPIREILFRAARRARIELVLVANQPVRTPPSRLIRSLQVPGGFDVADNEIVARVEAGDLVITSDIPLAAQVIDKGAQALSPRGERYSPETIRDRLNMRDFMDTLRSSGVRTGGPPALDRRDHKAFADELDRFLARHAAKR